MIAFGEALDFQTKVGRAAIEKRSRELAHAAHGRAREDAGRQGLDLAQSRRRVAVVSFLPGTLDAGKLADALYKNDRIGITTRGGKDRPGLRVSPHFYNTPAEVDRLLASLSKYMKSGV